MKTPTPSFSAIPGVASFETALGVCAIAWSPRGIATLQLPERDPAATLARAARRTPDAIRGEPPAAIIEAIGRIQRQLSGAPGTGADDLADLVLDTEGIPEFHRRAQAMARTIPPGQTISYGEMAARLGEPGAARAVGQAMGSNPYPVIVPCHRVLAAAAREGGFSAYGGVATKRRLLALEGALAPEGLPLFAPARH